MPMTRRVLQADCALSGGGVRPLAASTRQQLVNLVAYRLRQQVQVGVQLPPSLPGQSFRIMPITTTY